MKNDLIYSDTGRVTGHGKGETTTEFPGLNVSLHCWGETVEAGHILTDIIITLVQGLASLLEPI